MNVPCPYCGKEAKLVFGSTIYPHRKDLFGKRFYLCQPCDAYVGCHPDTAKPLGRLANAQLRKEKMKAHAAFDPLWRRGDMTRTEAYKWLAEELKIAPQNCHIGMFDVGMCKAAVSAMNRKEKP